MELSMKFSHIFTKLINSMGGKWVFKSVHINFKLLNKEKHGATIAVLSPLAKLLTFANARYF